MIKNRRDLKEYIKEDTKPFRTKSIKIRIWAFITKDFNYYRIKYCKHLRMLEYYSLHPKLFFLLKWHHKYQKNRIGRMFGWEVPSWTCGKGLHIWHPNVVINDDAKIGDYALFHGNNCVGRKDDTLDGNFSPIIGSGLNFGFGACAFGNISIGSNVIVGANSTVLNDVPNNCVVVGSPAKIIKRLD